MKQIISLFALLILAASSVMAQTSDAKNLKSLLRQGKMEIVNGKYDEASEKFIEVWQHTDHTRESMEALYMLAVMAEYGIGRECNQPNASESYFTAAEAGNIKAKEAVYRIDKYGFAEPTEENRKAVIKQVHTDVLRETFLISTDKLTRRPVAYGLTCNCARILPLNADPSNKYYKLVLTYRVASNSTILKGAFGKAAIAERLTTLPIETFFPYWNIGDLLKSLDLKVIIFYINYINYNIVGQGEKGFFITRIFLRENDGVEFPAKVR